MLREVAGKPLLAWTYEAARACPQFTDVVIAIDSEEVEQLCRIHGWPYRMTSPALQSGTDRLYAVSQEIEADLYVNVQGDEPLISSTHIGALLEPFQNARVDASTLKVPCEPGEIDDPNAVKVVTALDGRALYFSRSPIPFDRDRQGSAQRYKHLGLYAYRRAALQEFAKSPQSPLEQTERLEQLRLLENGLALYVREVQETTVGVDTESDLWRVEQLLLARKRQAASDLEL